MAIDGTLTIKLDSLGINMEHDLVSIMLAVEQFEEENADTSNTWTSEELHHYYSQNTI